MGTEIVLFQDTGWILPTLATDVTVTANRIHLGYRKIEKVVHAVIALSVANPATDKLLFTFPVGFRLGAVSADYTLANLSGMLVRIYGNGECRANSAATAVTGLFTFPTA